LKLTCFHFQILYLKQRTFSFLEQRSRIKLSSLSLLVDTTRLATSLLQRNRKSSNIDPHFFTYSCACFLPITFQKTINQEWSITPDMTILSQFREKIIENNLSKDLGGKCVVLHLLIPYNSWVLKIMQETRSGESSFTVKILKIMKIKIENVYTLVRQLKILSDSFKSDVDVHILHTRLDTIILKSKIGMEY